MTKVPYNMQQTTLRVINSVPDCPIVLESDIYEQWKPVEGADEVASGDPNVVLSSEVGYGKRNVALPIE